MSDSVYNIFSDLLYNPLFVLSIRQGLWRICNVVDHLGHTRWKNVFQSLTLNTDQILKRPLPKK